MDIGVGWFVLWLFLAFTAGGLTGIVTLLFVMGARIQEENIRKYQQSMKEE